jgi:hypothetical protein
MNTVTKRGLISLLKKYGKVFISSEEKNIPSEFKKYLLKIDPVDFTDVLYYSSIVVSEGTTTASEAALLGVPTIYVNKYRSGNMDEEINKYKIMLHITEKGKLFKKLSEMLSTHNLRERWEQKRKKLFADKTNVTEWMVNFIESYQR